MKRLIALILLLLAPVVASAGAVCPPQPCVATSGSAVVDFDFPFNFAGKGFSASGAFTEYGSFDSPFTVTFLEIGSTYNASIGGLIDANPNPLLTQFELTVNGVPWGIPAGGFPTGGYASVEFDAILPVDGSLEVTRYFTFDGSFHGAPEPFAPGLGCDVLNCETLNFSGHGIVTFDLFPYGGDFGGPFMALEGETFKLLDLPEPSTASLLLLGFAGLAVMGSRRKSRVRCSLRDR